MANFNLFIHLHQHKHFSVKFECAICVNIYKKIGASILELSSQYLKLEYHQHIAYERSIDFFKIRCDYTNLQGC